MKLNSELFLLKDGCFARSQDFENIMIDLRRAINAVTWSDKSKFIIKPVRKGNGVVPIKEEFIRALELVDWKAEVRMAFVDGMAPGPVDIVKHTSFGQFAVEWETGNISSSHRALNKMAVGLLQGSIIGGILILPVRKLAQFLTDRIGNFEEIAPYFVLYKSLQISDGVLGIISVDYDDLSENAFVIPKGKDGNARKF